MKLKRIYSEQPEVEIWENLLKYTYPENIKKYFSKNHNSQPSDDLINIISGSLSQAYEYFSLSRKSSLQVSPLLIYYGSTNLIHGTLCLVYGKLLKIRNHGMKLRKLSGIDRIGDVTLNINDNKTGGLSIFVNEYNPYKQEFSSNIEWSFEEIAGSIVELSNDFSDLYGQENIHAIPIKEIILDNEVQYRVNLDIFNETQVTTLLKSIPGFSRSYFPFEKNRNNELIIRKKIHGQKLHEVTTMGESFFLAGYTKDGKQISFPYFSLFLMLLFMLGMLCRYNPEFWNPFVERDNSGERNFVEKLIRVSRRQLPNLMLDLLTGEKNMYNMHFDLNEDKRKNLSEKDIRELIEEELNLRRLP